MDISIKEGADELTPIDELYDANEQLRRDVNIREIRMRQAEAREEGWRARAEAAEAEVERLRAALVKHHDEPNRIGCEICDLADV